MFSRADAYERFMGRWSRLLAPALVRFCDVRDGDAVVDVGCGTGALSWAVFEATKRSRIFGVDPTLDYVTEAARRISDARVTFGVGDGQALELPDEVFDKVMSLLALNFIPDAPRAVREWMRVTKPRGCVAAAVWDYPAGMQMLRVFWDEAIALDPAIAPRDEAHMPLCKRGELGSLWRQQGLVAVEEAPLDIALSFTSFDDFWAPFLLGQGPAGAYVLELSKARRAELEQRLRKRLLGDGGDRPLAMEARAWAVKGLVPEV